MAGFFDTLFGGGAEKEAADKNRQLYNQYQSQGQGYLSTGYDTSKGDLNNALGVYQGLADKYGKGTDLYLNALGVNGTGGSSAAWDAFQNANPQTQGVINQGLDAINRRRASADMVNSGNADLDALNFAQNTQNQQYNSWLSNLSGVNQNNLTASAGEAGAYGSLSDLAQKYAGDQTSLLGNTTGGLVGANNLQAQGEAAGAKNLLGAGLSLASLATGGLGGGLGSALGGLGSSLGSMGITYGMPGTKGSNLFGPVAP